MYFQSNMVHPRTASGEKAGRAAVVGGWSHQFNCPLPQRQKRDLGLLRETVAEAHAQGLRVLLDFVANHVHEAHPYFRDHRDWFGTLDLPDGSLNLRRWDDYRLTTWFEPYLPSFDYEASPEAVEQMTADASVAPVTNEP